MTDRDTNTATVIDLIQTACQPAIRELHTQHVAELAHAHTNTIRLTTLQSGQWDEGDADTIRLMTARAQRRADRDNKPWKIVSCRSILLATVQPSDAVVAAESADPLDFSVLV